MRAALDERFAACGLVLHPQKTKIVYCKDTNRKGRHPTILFDFLGYRFQPRLTAWPNGKYPAAPLDRETLISGTQGCWAATKQINCAGLEPFKVT